MGNYNFGIALSGGGARGIAHIGVLHALHKYGIEPGIVSGTSMGAIVGVLYASGRRPLEIFDIIKSQKMHRVLNWHLPSSGLLNMENIKYSLAKYIPEDNFSNLKKPFYCAVSNLNKGIGEVISEGELLKWVIASASIPIVFEPQIINNETYVDGGLFNNLPSECIAGKCEFVIGSHVNHNKVSSTVKGIRTIAERTFNLSMAQNVRPSMKLCNVMIDPPKLLDYNSFDFNKAQDLFNIGFEETERIILHIFKGIDIDMIKREQEKQKLPIKHKLV